MAIRTLVVGGTGPSGVHIVNFLLAAGHRVSVFNSGQHDDGVSRKCSVQTSGNASPKRARTLTECMASWRPTSR